MEEGNTGLMISNNDLTKRIRLYGIVQGVGFRPFVSRAAMEAGIHGSVCNRGSYVEVIARGEASKLEQFIEVLRTNPPERSVILKIDVKDTSSAEPLERFDIIESEKEAGEIFISPDIATCPECSRELFDPSNRRYLHPFINCTQCGPRLTILDELPYDRARTSMKEFPMCPSCAAEYEDPASRRYDAQPVCCNDCGPEVYLTGSKERGREAITAARRMLIEGKILAVKGIGGYHLCCDATSDEAVSRLRSRKARPVKPFAVMMKDEKTVMENCFLNKEQKRILTGHQKPILLLERRKRSSLCEAVSPGNPKVGVMLPYAPVQMLLFDYPDGLKMPDMLVMTSGNVSGAPICRDDEEAVRELGSFVDAILSHNRKIRIRCDDSVMDFENGRPYMIRRSRGYAPLPVLLGGDYRQNVLAVGAELKNTFCLGLGSLFYPSAYVGDLADPRSVQALQESIHRMETLLETKANVIACDLHPGYHSTEVALQIAKERGVELIQVQHHFAHIVSCMAENDITGEVLGASFDGTGWGEDETVWGGELMRADRGGYQRFGSIKPFHMVGGDQASRQGWQIACSMIHDLYPDEEMAKSIVEKLSLCDPSRFKIISRMSDRGLNTVISTSAGRLFDTVSALLGVCRESTFEGEAATSLQFAAQRYLVPENKRDSFWHEEMDMQREPLNVCKKTAMQRDLRNLCEEAAIREDSRKSLKDDTRQRKSPNPEGDEFDILPTDVLVKWIIEERMKGEDPSKLAYLFHDCLAAMISRALLNASRKTGLNRVVLTGGVYQNTLLLHLTKQRLEDGTMTVYTHHLIPPNDGGICLGQAVAAQEIMKLRHISE